jgi:hypothetical protein
MVIFLYSDKNYEHQAMACIKSFESKITDDIKVLYFTIGFESDFECKNLYKQKIDYLDYPTFHYYKAELSLKALEYFPQEEYFIFTDTDILFSKRLYFEKLKNQHSYPLGVFGPHEYPFIYETINGEFIQYNESKLMEYMNVNNRSIMYQMSCFYTFNRNCIDFLEEYTSLCKNKYLLDRRKWYFPFHDETPFNICLWKRKANHSLGYAFVNTHKIETVKFVEESDIKDFSPGKNLDKLGRDWEYIKDSSNIILYHGFKEKQDIDESLKYLLNKS